MFVGEQRVAVGGGAAVFGYGLCLGFKLRFLGADAVSVRSWRACVCVWCMQRALINADCGGRSTLNREGAKLPCSFPVSRMQSDSIRSFAWTQIALHNTGMHHLKSKSGRAALLLCNVWAGWLGHA